MGKEGTIPGVRRIVIIKGQKHVMFEKCDALVSVLVTDISKPVIARNRVPYVYLTLDIHPGDRTFGIVWDGAMEQLKDVKIGSYVNCLGKKSDTVNTFNVFEIEALSDVQDLEPEIGPVGTNGPIEEFIPEEELSEATRPVE